MKQNLFFVWLCICVLSACSDESNHIFMNETQDNRDEFTLTEDMSVQSLHRSFDEPALALRSTNTIYYDGGDWQGCPGETGYLFAVKDWYNEPPIAVKLYSPSGNTYYVPLLRLGNYQYRVITLHTPGRWYWRYVFTLNKLPCQPDKGSSIKDNTLVRYEDNQAHIVWPFSSELCWVMTCGHHCGAHTIANGEQYAQDWACTTGSFGKSILSPLDGVISKVAWAPATYGHYIEIDQELGGYRLRFRVAHVAETNAYLHQVVKAGETTIGLIGSTGNSTGPHAHCSMFLVDDDGEMENIDFMFVEECLE